MTLPAELLLSEYVLDGEQAVVMEQRAIARKWFSVFQAVDLAMREPWTQLGPESRVTGPAAVKLAETSVVAELAVRFMVTEGTIKNYAHTARVLVERLPGVWERFAEGFVHEQNASEAARLVQELPESCWREFDRQVVDVIAALTPSKFRLKALAIRERLQPTTADTRHAVAREQRRVWVEPDIDGMAWLGAYLPVDVAHKGKARIDALALELSKLPDETRTMQQLRADVFADTIAGDHVLTAKVSLALTIPAMTTLDNGTEPAVLDGVGPIPLGMAKELAGGPETKSFVRVLTDPITGTVLNMEGRTRRIPKAMRRYLRTRDRVCTFPGCNRPATGADIDHTKDVQYGGITANGNLAHLCRKHHTLKHKTNWRYVQPPATKPGQAPPRATWTSPLGHTTTSDPPPF